MQFEKNHDGPIEHSLEIALETIEGLLHDSYPLSRRAVGLLLLQEDHEIQEMVKESQPTIIDHIEKIISGVKAHYAYPIEYEIALRRRDEVERIINRVVKVTEKDTRDC